MRKKLQTAFQLRQYMISRDFELYYYEDRDLAKVAAHTHDYYEFCFFLEGDVSMKIGESLYPIQYGDMLLIPPGASHRVVIHSMDVPYRRFIFWISREFCRQLHQMSPYYNYIMQQAEQLRKYMFHLDRITFNTLQSKMIRLLEEMRSEHFGKELQMTLYVDDFILCLNRIGYELLEPKKAPADTSLYTNIAEFIEEHLDEDLSLERLAEEFYVSKYHIAHVFKENLGLSIHQYITKKRLRLCEEALCTGMPITDICQTYGFGDYSSFYRAFKKEYGISPKEYRTLHSSNASLMPISVTLPQ